MATTRKKGADIRRSSSRRSRWPKARHHATEGWRRLGVVAAVLSLCLAGCGAAAQERETDCEGVVCLARAVIDTIPNGERIALVPFLWPVTDLPEQEANSLYSDLFNAMFLASKGRHKLVRRDSTYDELWETTKWEVAGSNYQKYVDRLRATVVVHCKDRGVRKGMLKLSCTAAGVDASSSLAGEMRPSIALIPFEQGIFLYEYALTQLSNSLAAGARDSGSGPQAIPTVFVADTDGQLSELTKDIGQRVVDGIARRFEIFQHEQQSQDVFEGVKGRQTEDAAETPVDYELHGTFVWVDEKHERASLRVELLEGDRSIARKTIALRRDWLPHTIAVPKRYVAEARAKPSDRLHADIASNAALNLARARVVAQALGIRAPAVKVVRSEAEGITALQTLAQGIPVDEQVNSWQEATGEWHVWLKARVISIGGQMQPALEATLSNSDLMVGEKYGITLSAASTVHVGLFALGADGGVVRLYPNAKVKDLIVFAGERVSLPRSGDAYQDFWSAPLPGHVENHEAIIVVASNKPLDFASIGASVGSSATETMKHAIRTRNLLDSLGGLDLSQATLVVLPYRVRL